MLCFKLLSCTRLTLPFPSSSLLCYSMTCIPRSVCLPSCLHVQVKVLHCCWFSICIDCFWCWRGFCSGRVCPYPLLSTAAAVACFRSLQDLPPKVAPSRRRCCCQWKTAGRGWVSGGERFEENRAVGMRVDSRSAAGRWA